MPPKVGRDRGPRRERSRAEEKKTNRFVPCSPTFEKTFMLCKFPDVIKLSEVFGLLGEVFALDE